MGSVGKLRILDLLSKVGELNVTAIARRTKLNHTRVKIHLRELQEFEIISEKIFGRIRIYSINENNETGRKLNNFLQDWRTIDGIDRVNI